MPELEGLAKEFISNTKLLFVSIDSEGRKVAKPYVMEKGYKSIVLLDPYQRTAKKYGVKAVPALFLIDRSGVIRYVGYGYKEEEGVSRLKKALEELETKE